jgi:hypothetical protein
MPLHRTGPSHSKRTRNIFNEDDNYDTSDNESDEEAPQLQHRRFSDLRRTDSEDEGEENESDSSEEEQDEEGEAWLQVMKKVGENLGIEQVSGENAQMLFDEPKLTNTTIPKIIEVTEGIFKQATTLEDSKFYSHIKAKMERLEEEGYPHWEAQLSAWSDRRFLVKDYFLTKVLNKEDESEGDDDEEKEEETPSPTGPYMDPLTGQVKYPE